MSPRPKPLAPPLDIRGPRILASSVKQVFSRRPSEWPLFLLALLGWGVCDARSVEPDDIPPALRSETGSRDEAARIANRALYEDALKRPINEDLVGTFHYETRPGEGGEIELSKDGHCRELLLTICPVALGGAGYNVELVQTPASEDSQWFVKGSVLDMVFANHHTIYLLNHDQQGQLVFLEWKADQTGLTLQMEKGPFPYPDRLPPVGEFSSNLPPSRVLPWLKDCREAADLYALYGMATLWLHPGNIDLLADLRKAGHDPFPRTFRSFMTRPPTDSRALMSVWTQALKAQNPTSAESSATDPTPADLAKYFFAIDESAKLTEPLEVMMNSSSNATFQEEGMCSVILSAGNKRPAMLLLGALRVGKWWAADFSETDSRLSGLIGKTNPDFLRGTAIDRDALRKLPILPLSPTLWNRPEKPPTSLQWFQPTPPQWDPARPQNGPFPFLNTRPFPWMPPP